VTFRGLGSKVFTTGDTIRAVIVGPRPATTRITVNAYAVTDNDYAARINTSTNPFPTAGNYDATLEAVDGSNVLQLSGEPVRISVKPTL